MLVCSPEVYSKVSFLACESYIAYVKSGKQSTNRWIKAAIERGERDRASGKWDLRYEEVERVYEFFSRLRIPNAVGKVEPFRLSPYQSWMLFELFLYYDKETGARRFTEMVYFTSRKSGKTLIATAIAFYLSLCCGYEAPEIYFAASGIKQSSILLKYSKQLARYSEFLKVRIAEFMFVLKTKSMGTFQAISSKIDGSQEGTKPLVSIFDEAHALPSNALRTALLSGMGWSLETMSLTISTAGTSITNYFYQQVTHGKMILETESLNDEKTLYILFTLDDGDLKKEDILTNSDYWIKANPNLMVTPPIERFRDDLHKASLIQADLQQFHIKNFNVFNSDINLDRLFSMTDINRNSAKINIEELYGGNLYLGLDLAPKIDMSSIGCFIEKDGIYYSWVDLYVAGSRESLNRAGTKIHLGDYKEFVNINWNQEVTDYQAIVDRCEFYVSKFNVIGLGYDAAFSSVIISQITRLGIDVYSVKQYPVAYNEPILLVENALASDKIVMDDNSLLKYCFYNCLGRQNEQGMRIFAKKESKIFGDSIDAVVSILTAVNVYIGQNFMYSAIYKYLHPEK